MKQKNKIYSDYKVSVVMNCFNGQDFLSEAVNSVLNQSHKNFEIIFWDNQSTDNSAKIIKEMGDPRIKYFLSQKHTNLYSARNEALKNCCGEFIAFLDVDDAWEKYKLESQLNIFEDQNINLVYSNYWLLIQGSDRTEARKTLACQKKLFSGWALASLCSEYQVGLLTVMIRSSFLRKTKINFDGRFHIIGDLDLVLRVAAVSRIGSVDAPLATYRIHGNNESQRHQKLELDELKIWRSEITEKPGFALPYIIKRIEKYIAFTEARQCYLDRKYGRILQLVPRIGWVAFLLILLKKFSFSQFKKI
jgi:glycosyltransferase involved in cell wall biosynthesis